MLQSHPNGESNRRAFNQTIHQIAPYFYHVLRSSLWRGGFSSTKAGNKTCGRSPGTNYNNWLLLFRERYPRPHGWGTGADAAEGCCSCESSKGAAKLVPGMYETKGELNEKKMVVQRKSALKEKLQEYAWGDDASVQNNQSTTWCATSSLLKLVDIILFTIN